MSFPKIAFRIFPLGVSWSLMPTDDTYQRGGQRINTQDNKETQTLSREQTGSHRTHSSIVRKSSYSHIEVVCVCECVVCGHPYTQLLFNWQKIASELNAIKGERGRIKNCFYVFHCATGSNLHASGMLRCLCSHFRAFASQICLASPNTIRCKGVVSRLCVVPSIASLSLITGCKIQKASE
jgi:hypothetical protein